MPSNSQTESDTATTRAQQRAAPAPLALVCAPFASLGAAIEKFARSLPWNRSDAQGSAVAGAGQTEAKTGTFFPARFCQRGNSHCGTLQGVG